MIEQEPFFEAVLPMPVTINDYYGGGRGAGIYVKPKGNRYHEEVFYLCRLYSKVKPVPRYSGRIYAEFIFHFDPQVPRADIDNFNKCLWDSLTYAGVWLDDSQVDEYRTRRGEPVKGGQVVVRLFSHNNLMPPKAISPTHPLAPCTAKAKACKTKKPKGQAVSTVSINHNPEISEVIKALNARTKIRKRR